MSVPHPIPYQGSKRAIAPAILAHFPPDSCRLIEPFAGSAAVSLAAAYYGKASQFVLNDVNAPLMELWDHIINRPEWLAARYRRLWEEQHGRKRKYYDLIREKFNRTQRPDYLLYLLARCVKASIRYNSCGEFNQSPDNRRTGANPATMANHITRVSRFLRGKTTVMCGDYRTVVKQAAPRDILYMDPPYQGVCGNRDPRYFNGLRFEEFVETLGSLNRADMCYIVSYDGRTGSKTYGRPMPVNLGLTHLEVDAGRSSQATLLGRDSRTYESLYLSPALVCRIGKPAVTVIRDVRRRQPELMFA